MQQVDSPRLSVGDILSRAHAAAPKKPTPTTRTNAFASLVGEVLNRKSSASKSKGLEDYMADLDADEREFADNPSRERFETYRKTVKALVSMLLSRGYRLQGWEDKKKRRYEVVKTIDTRLAQLYSSLLRRNQDVVIALHLMGEIRGLIFDLNA